MLTDELVQERAVAADRDVAVALRRDERPPALAHRLEVELAVVGAPDRAREQLRTTGRNDHPGIRVAHDVRRLARVLGRRDHRPPDREHAVEPARHDVAGEPLSEPDDVNVRGRERVGEDRRGPGTP